MGNYSEMKTWNVVAAFKKPLSNEEVPPATHRAIIEGPRVTEPMELVEKVHLLELVEEIEILKKKVELLERTSWGIM